MFRNVAPNPKSLYHPSFPFSFQFFQLFLFRLYPQALFMVSGAVSEASFVRLCTLFSEFPSGLSSVSVPYSGFRAVGGVGSRRQSRSLNPKPSDFGSTWSPTISTSSRQMRRASCGFAILWRQSFTCAWIQPSGHRV